MFLFINGLNLEVYCMSKWEKALLWISLFIAAIAVCFRFHAYFFMPRYALVECSYALFGLLVGIALVYFLIQLGKRLIRLLDHRPDQHSEKDRRNR